jgi:hypothetical protein
MSALDLERTLYHLSLRSPLVERHPGDPAGALEDLRRLAASHMIADLRAVNLPRELTDEEARLIDHGDVAEMYRRGVHPNTIRNFAGNFGIDYVQRYREAGLRHD